MKKFLSVALCLIIFLSLFAPAVTASATGKRMSVYCSDDKSFLSVENATSLKILKKYPEATHLYLKNCVIDDLNAVKDMGYDKIEFVGCDFDCSPATLDGNYEEFRITGCEGDWLSAFRKVSAVAVVFSGMVMENLESASAVFGTIRELYLHEMTLFSLDGLENFIRLERLDILHAKLDDISPITELRGLTQLTLSETASRDISAISEMTCLRQLKIDCMSRLESLDFLTEMPWIKSLVIIGTEMAYTEKLVSYLKTTNAKYDKDALDSQRAIRRMAEKIAKNTESDRERLDAVVLFVCEYMTYNPDVRLTDEIIANADEEFMKEYGKDEFPEVYGKELTAEFNNRPLYHAVKGLGNCRNYTEMTTALLNCLGIEAYSILGTYESNHIWNLVLIDGEYIWLDVTKTDDKNFTVAKDRISRGEHIYSLSDKTFLGEHPQVSLPQTAFEELSRLQAQEILADITASENDNTYPVVLILLLTGFTPLMLLIALIRNKKENP